MLVHRNCAALLERGDLDNAKIGTIRGYLEAIGGGLSLEYVLGDTRIQVA